MAHVVAVIPARGGSKGLPRKNLLPLGGKPLIAWTIEGVLASRAADRVVVSTDDSAIAEVAGRAGAEVPFIRPAELAGDASPTYPVLRHAVEVLERGGPRIDWLLAVQATNPFVRPATYAAAVRRAVDEDLPLLASVVPVREHPYWMRVISGDRIHPFVATWSSLRRQDLPPVYILNGAIYVYRRDRLDGEAPPGDLPAFLAMDRREGVDIDDREDLDWAEFLLGRLEEVR
ncbi:MAG: acylneuraminate cytidylyltransferase family protein [Planctomycetes bacterium]|nr:acylneuraminate cytidylyltransferase family protein [Planctomycetota bacterium]